MERRDRGILQITSVLRFLEIRFGGVIWKRKKEKKKNLKVVGSSKSIESIDRCRIEKIMGRKIDETMLFNRFAPERFSSGFESIGNYPTK